MLKKAARRTIQTALLLNASATFMVGHATAAAAQAKISENRTQVDIPAQPLAAALRTFGVETDSQVLFSKELVEGRTNRAVKGDYSPSEALGELLKGTNLHVEQTADRVFLIKGLVNTHAAVETAQPVQPMQLAQASPPRASVETVTVTSSKLGGADVQSIPIAITALSQEQLTSSQTAGGPDLVKQVPNLTFTKTNFTGYSIQIRGIGTQAISVTTDPAVAVALNDIPFIRNHFFEQEFYDLSQAEVLRGPQGTLYGRNATAGVVNLVTAKPTDQFEAMASGDIGNYHNRRFEGMVNLPIVDDWLDIRLAGEWTKRNGYTTNALTGSDVDGRDLWSGRLSIAWKPIQNLQANFVWEHFSEDDDRMRTAKQLCKTDNPTNHPEITNVLGLPVSEPSNSSGNAAFQVTTGSLSQGCLPASLYAPESFEVPYGYSLPYVVAGWYSSVVRVSDPYVSTVQSSNLRVIETQIDPRYQAKNDTVEFNADYNITPALTFTSQTGYNSDFLWSTEDYNRFNTAPGIFQASSGNSLQKRTLTYLGDDDTYYFCDPQLGCSNRLVAQDISREHAWQFSQEFRLASKFSGPFNFSAGGNWMHYETEEDYFVFANVLTAFAATSGTGQINQPWVAGLSDNSQCLSGSYTGTIVNHGGYGHQYPDPTTGAGQPTSTCYYIDPNSLDNINSQGHNYFLSQNPYTLNSYAGFGEAYYDVAPDLKLTGGLRWTEDRKHFVDIPSELLASGYGYATIGTVDQVWDKFTGRFAANWTPKLDFTDQTLVYGSFAHGYKAGGANPPGATIYAYGTPTGNGIPVHPLTFDPEFVDAFELGTKNTLLDGTITFNGDVFFYKYKGYQISEIVDRTSINLNFDATVKGAEIEATYEPVPGLKLHFAGGYENTHIADGQSAVDLMDRTAGHAGWMVFRPFVTEPSNCVFPAYVVAAMISVTNAGEGNPYVSACEYAYGGSGEDPVVQGVYHSSWNGAADPLNNLVPGQPYYNEPQYAGDPVGVNYGYPVTANGLPYPGFDPLAGTPGSPYAGQNTYNGVDYGPAPNNGAGFSKNLGGNELPNAPPFTVSFSAEYTLPVTPDWAATLRGDYYWQDYSWARVFNDNPYDRLRGYTNVNLALILTSQEGWQVMGYIKNVFNVTDITGTFLNSDDSGLTTNVFLTDPRLFGIRVTKNW
ncbi:MAG TPA: TonB-dependent receptor [Rhizomicrobium sp.]|nr:TonB-dependent receptor [Rhizomicrobium sp.]